MKIEITKVQNNIGPERCYVHARGLIMPSGNGIMTMQKLELSGSDVFYGIEIMKTYDGGKSFTAPVPCKNLQRKYFDNGTSFTLCDATPFYHKATSKTILIGHTAWYNASNDLLEPPRPRATGYAIYDEKTGDFGELHELSLKGDEYFSQGAGCTQICELPSGEILIPIYYKSLEDSRDPWNTSYKVSVMRCSFDGETVSVIEVGASLTVETPRGLCEPSLVKFGDEYLLSLRNDVMGYAAKSKDGLRYDAPVPLVFDDGELLGNYNTQQHWLVGKDSLYLVYTRKAGTNDHVFRHRAPLFIAKFDTDSMCVVRESERIAVPERGARLGNFGCQSFSNDVGYVFAAEWMQCGKLGWDVCAEHGSDNTIFISKITY